MASIAFARRALKHITPMARAIATTATRRFCSLPPSPAPWLRVPADMGDSEFVEFDNFYNIVDKRLFKLETLDTYCLGSYRLFGVGSSRGSLAFFGENGRLYIAFAYTGGGDKLSCPKFEHDPHSLTRFYTKLGDDQYGDVDTFLCYPTYHSKNPTPINFHDFYVHWPNSVWTRYPNLFHKDDPPIVYCQKTKTVYKFSCYGNEHGPWVVELWDMSDDDRINVTSRINVALDSSYEIESFEKELRARCHQDRFLVLTGDEGGRGDPVLYLVVRHHNRELGVSQTRAVDVFRFDLVGQKMIYTTQLDNHAFFIGKRSDSFAIPVEQCGPAGGLKSDSVYIADDLRVFDLKDRSITPIIDTGDLFMARFQSLWIPPPSHGQMEDIEERKRRRGECESDYSP